MRQPYIKYLGLAALLGLALALSACGGSKKGNSGYGMAPATHPVQLTASSGRLPLEV